MPLLTKLALDCVKKYFGVSAPSAEEVREKSVLFSGAPFENSLRIVFPGEDKEELRKQCAEEFNRRKPNEVYSKARSFPSMKEVLQTFAENGTPVMISSAFEKGLIKEWAEREKVLSLIIEIFGVEQGSKKEHMEQIYQKYPDRRIIYISDSPRDMKLGDISIGIAPPELEQQFRKAGAKVVIPSIRYLPETKIIP